jgi:hypothetical protein
MRCLSFAARSQALQRQHDRRVRAEPGRALLACFAERAADTGTEVPTGHA